LIGVRISTWNGERILGGRSSSISVHLGRPNLSRRLHIHPTSSHPERYPELHLVYKYIDSYYQKTKQLILISRDANTTFNFERDESITTTLWHSDVSYELQPPGLTTFFLLSQPTTGGDTLFTSQVSTLKRFSPLFVAFLRTLKAVHSGVEQALFSRAGKRGGIVRREPVENVHPVVRRHPVTSEEALYVNRQFTRRIVGLKREESGEFSPLMTRSQKGFDWGTQIIS
jgi:sulfonate dioxygenase